MVFVFVFSDWLQIDEITARLIWRPVIKFENLLDFKQTKAYGNTVHDNLWIHGNTSHHVMEYGEEFQLTIPCRFELAKFPFDSHECPLEYGDKIYDTENLNFNSSHIIHGNKSIRFGDRWFSVTRFDYNRA